ncbi:MAG: response regulator [Bacillota bacterium]|nr:response regulator [Bacillota bacterium]
MSEWRALYVDDEAEILSTVEEWFNNIEKPIPGIESLKFDTETDFEKAYERMTVSNYDVVILDLRMIIKDVEDDEAGTKLLDMIRNHCFLPVIFYTGLPHLVSHLESAAVRIVEKTESFEGLEAELQYIWSTGLPSTNRALFSHLREILKDYMWDFAMENWDEFAAIPDKTSVAHVLAKRIGASLNGSGVLNLINKMGLKKGNTATKVHPVQYYIMPPIEPILLAGDIFFGSINGITGHWVLLSPTCDLAKDNTDMALLAFGKPLQDHDLFDKWCNGTDKGKLNSLLLNRNGDREYFLPASLKLPDLVVDLQSLIEIPIEHLSTLERIASLDSQFAAEVQLRFVRYYGRRGVPDLDASIILERLEEYKKAKPADIIPALTTATACQG